MVGLENWSPMQVMNMKNGIIRRNEKISSEKLKNQLNIETAEKGVKQIKSTREGRIKNQKTSCGRKYLAHGLSGQHADLTVGSIFSSSSSLPAGSNLKSFSGTNSGRSVGLTNNTMEKKSLRIEENNTPLLEAQTEETDHPVWTSVTESPTAAEKPNSSTSSKLKQTTTARDCVGSSIRTKDSEDRMVIRGLPYPLHTTSVELSYSSHPSCSSPLTSQDSSTSSFDALLPALEKQRKRPLGRKEEEKMDLFVRRQGSFGVNYPDSQPVEELCLSEAEDSEREEWVGQNCFPPTNSMKLTTTSPRTGNSVLVAWNSPWTSHSSEKENESDANDKVFGGVAGKEATFSATQEAEVIEGNEKVSGFLSFAKRKRDHLQIAGKEDVSCTREVHRENQLHTVSPQRATSAAFPVSTEVVATKEKYIHELRVFFEKLDKRSLIVVKSAEGGKYARVPSSLLHPVDSLSRTTTDMKSSQKFSEPNFASAAYFERVVKHMKRQKRET